MAANLWVGVLGTLTLWLVSGTLAVLLGFVMAAGSLSGSKAIHLLARSAINGTRGVPTSVLVIVAGMGMMRTANAPQLPAIFPGTLIGFQHVAWGIALSLAFGSAGHLAEIFASARSTLGQYRLEQMTVLGLSSWSRIALEVRECAAVALPPTGARLVHHLHNTAFAALFPVTDLFGFIQGQSSSTFRVIEFILVGSFVYVGLSGLIWLATRALEAAYAPPATRRTRRRALGWSRT